MGDGDGELHSMETTLVCWFYGYEYERMNDRMNVSMAQNDLYSILNSDINVLLSIHEK